MAGLKPSEQRLLVDINVPYAWLISYKLVPGMLSEDQLALVTLNLTADAFLS